MSAPDKALNDDNEKHDARDPNFVTALTAVP